MRIMLFLLLLALRPAMSADATTVLITGANRGIGLEFVRQLSERDWRIIATARKPGEAAELKALADEHDIIIEQLDVTDHPRVDALAAKYQDQPIDYLILNAAMGPTAKTAMTQLKDLDWERGRQSLEVNTIGPMKMAQAFMPHVEASEKKTIIAMSSDSGSLEASAPAPILYHYKMSKAALNMYMRTLSYATKRRGVTLIMLHPGIVGTNENLARMPGALETPDSVRQMLSVIDGLAPADNGRFVNYLGETMPW